MTINYWDAGELAELLNLQYDENEDTIQVVKEYLEELNFFLKIKKPKYRCRHWTPMYISRRYSCSNLPSEEETTQVRIICQDWLKKFIPNNTHTVGAEDFNKVFKAISEIENNYAFLMLMISNVEMMWD